MSPDSSVITTQYELDHRLIFRAHLDLAKWRLAIAILFLAVVIGSLIYFFVLLGEQEILWQTSPLFIGVPIMGIAGQLLRLHATARKFVSSLPASQRLVRYVFRGDADAYEVFAGDSYSLFAWSDHLKALERTGHFLLFYNRFDITVIPKSAFEPNGIASFREILQSKMGDRAYTKSD